MFQERMIISVAPSSVEASPDIVDVAGIDALCKVAFLEGMPKRYGFWSYGVFDPDYNAVPPDRLSIPEVINQRYGLLAVRAAKAYCFFTMH